MQSHEPNPTYKRILRGNYVVDASFKGHLGVPLTVYPWYLLCSLGILGDCNPQIPTV